MDRLESCHKTMGCPVLARAQAAFESPSISAITEAGRKHDDHVVLQGITRRSHFAFAGSAPMSKGRLEAFSDGVIAIIITIMVLEMKVPHGDTRGRAGAAASRCFSATC